MGGGPHPELEDVVGAVDDRVKLVVNFINTNILAFERDSESSITLNAGYVNNITTLSYTTDASFIDAYAGSNHNISTKYMTSSRANNWWYNLRSFPSGERNCYTLGSLVSGLMYLIRGQFLYGNYDGLDIAPVFDLHVGVN